MSQKNIGLGDNEVIVLYRYQSVTESKRLEQRFKATHATIFVTNSHKGLSKQNTKYAGMKTIGYDKTCVLKSATIAPQEAEHAEIQKGLCCRPENLLGMTTSEAFFHIRL